MYTRIIPRLDIKGPNLVKGISLEGLRVLGKPERFARHYYQHGADELVYMDVVASLYGRNSLLNVVERTAKEVFIPLTVGGGLRTLDDILSVLRAGADKVALNTGAIRRPQLISEAAERFGSSSIAVSIEAIKRPDGVYEVFTDNGRESTGINALDWANWATDLGAGELFVMSIDREGTGRGYDLELTRSIAAAVAVPVIASGGAGTLEHIAAAIVDGQADAVSLASMLHYSCAREFEFHDSAYSEEGNVQFLRGHTGFAQVEERTIEEVKLHLRLKGLDTRAPGLG